MEEQAPATEEVEEGHPARGNAWDVFWLFVRLGFTSFGGPAAHIAIMQNELVQRRKWLDDQKFLDLLGITNLIPGPNSTEMAIHLGLLRAGWPGLVAGGAGFILPAMLIVLLLAWAYVQYGSTPQAGWLLYGIKPVVIAVVAQALWQLGGKALKSLFLAAIAVLVVVGYFLGINEIALLFGGALLFMLVKMGARVRPGAMAVAFAPFASLGLFTAAPFSYTTLFLSFLKIGAILYGSGYVLLAFVRSEFVERLAWMTEQQLLDAIAIGQFTPGPFFTTATFIGFFVGGLPGALLATLGIFLPSFIFVAISQRALARFQNAPAVRSLLDGVNAAALGLMAAVAWQLGRAAVIDPLTAAISLAALLALIRFKVNSTWLIIAGALIGLLRMLVG